MMWSDAVVIALDITPDFLCGLALIPVSICRYPLRFQAAKEAFHWAIIPTVSPPTDAFFHPVSPDKLLIFKIRALASLIAMEHHILRLASRLICHSQRTAYQCRIGIC